MALSITNYYNLKKKFYKEHPRVEQRTWEEIDKFLNLHQIKFSGFDLPKPIFMLDEINFPNYVIDELRMQGISRPTSIQSMTWPSIFSGRDIMCIGLPTHSRVISYICPALVFIKEQMPEVRRQGPLVLIVTQTKEVAKEILTHAQMFMLQAQCHFCCLFDDENINTQLMQLRERDYDILIGNYHRLCEMLDNEMVNLKNVSFLVMDDFYRNRSARLSDEIKRVVNETRSDRQTSIYSRIVPSGLQKSNGDEFQNDAVYVWIGNDDIHVAHKDLPQAIHICTMAEKKKKLQDIITEIAEREKNFKILVYANGFKKIRITEKIIKELGIDTFAYERTNVGRRRRTMKEKVYYNFNATPNSVLVASDVVSSKVELPDLNYIINADFPVNLSLYLNRMRMSNIKKYISIFIAEDARHADRLIYVLNECRQEVPSVLFKISEAYTNSGKDVDRMPSLQEINEGLTKPVEKPIPKPLPPTVSSLSLETTASRVKRLSDDKIKNTVQTIGQLSPANNDQSSFSQTNELLLVNNSNNNNNNNESNITTSSIEISESNSSLVAATQSSASLSPNEQSSSSSTSSTSSSSSSTTSLTSSLHTIHTSSNRSNPLPIKRFKSFHHQRNNYHQQISSSSSSSSSSYFPQSNQNYTNKSNYQAAAAATHKPSAQYQTFQYNMSPYYLQQKLYNLPPTSNGLPYFYHQQQPPPPLPPPPHHHHHQVQSYYTTTTSTHPSQPQFNYHQMPPVTSQVLYQNGGINSYHQSAANPLANNLKLEPYEPTPQYSRPPHHHHQQQQQLQLPETSNQSFNYFTNPMPFKQEPSEPVIKQEFQSSAPANSSSDAALNIVNHLLNDKQVLNQLEKVAQSFRLN